MTSARNITALTLAPLALLFLVFGLAACEVPVEGTSGVETTPEGHHEEGHSHE